MASSNMVPQFLKYVRRDECMSEQMGIPLKFTHQYSNSLSDNWVLTVPNGYRLNVVYDSNTSTLAGISDMIIDFGLMGGEVLVFQREDRTNFKVYIIGIDSCEIQYPAIMHASQRGGPVEVRTADAGWRFLKYVSFQKPRFDEIDVPMSFLDEFRAHMPSSVKYVLNSHINVAGYYDDFKRTLAKFSRVRKVMGLSDFTSFDCLILTFEREGKFKLSFFDGRNVEIVLNNDVMQSGSLCVSLRYPSHFAIIVKPCHMRRYCHGVDVSTHFFRVSDFWKKKDTITAYDGSQSWKLEVRKRKSSKRATINRGWIQFRDDLQLDVGDRCWFKWLDESYHHFRIEVIRAIIELD